MVVTTNQLTELFDVTQQAISKWSTAGCPKDGYGKWDLKAVLQWWLENIYKSGDDTEEMSLAKLEYWQAKARGEKVKADLAEQKVMPVDEFRSAWVWRVSEVSTGLGAIPMRVSPLLVGKEEPEIRSILTTEVWNIRDKFARTGKFTPAPKAKKKTVAKKKSTGRKTGKKEVTV